MNSQSNTHLPILIVEDSEEDFDVLKITFDYYAIANPLLRVSNGSAVIPLLQDRLSKQEELPGLIILDLNLIGVDGREVLRRLKREVKFNSIPVVVLSTSSSPRDISASYLEGAAAYAVKPVNLERLEKFVFALKSFWLDHTILPRSGDLKLRGSI